MVYTVLYEYSNWKKSFEMHPTGLGLLKRLTKSELAGLESYLGEFNQKKEFRI
jgi:hypothetical protein